MNQRLEYLYYEASHGVLGRGMGMGMTRERILFLNELIIELKAFSV